MILNCLFPNENLGKFDVFEGESGKSFQIDATSHFPSTFVIFCRARTVNLGENSTKTEKFQRIIPETARILINV